MLLMSSAVELATQYRLRREASETERMISALPANIRADIGWPAAVQDRFCGLTRRHH